MKRRIYNTLARKLKNKKLVLSLTNVMYALLYMFYVIARIFISKKTKLSSEDARTRLNDFSPKPDMNCTCINKAYTKDLSIIVPAYNADKTIAKCIESVINQNTICDYELIIINDGSTDNTGAVIERYEDNHIVLINQENKGFSGARNAGIDASVGRYIMFLDSDDYLVGNCIDMMMSQIIEQDADIVQGNYYTFVDGNEANISQMTMEPRVSTDRKGIVRNPGFPWAKIYKREMFNNLRFPLDVWFEDTIVSMILFRMCRKMVVTDQNVYAYRINPEGITAKARHSKKCVDHYWVMENVIKQAHANGLPDDEVQYVMAFGHMSTLLYRRISLMDNEVIEAAFVLACDLLNQIRPKGIEVQGRLINKDLEKAFRTRNYRLWKIASFII